MTNSEAIKLLSQEKIPMTLDGKLNESLVIAHIKAISALEENTKLKAEIERIKEDYSVLARQYNDVENSSIRYYNEVKQLKAELEQARNLMPKICETCQYEDEIGWKEPCNSCKNGNNWKQKGQVEE
jgi:predicted  nucleic acid-binding Zn-ribbon protein